MVAVEPPVNSELNSSGVIWVVHGQQHYRCAPEHLRVATPVEIHIDQAINGRSSSDMSRNLRNATFSRYRDLLMQSPPSDSDDRQVEEFGFEADSKNAFESIKHLCLTTMTILM